MLIQDKNSVLGLKSIISKLFDAKFDDFDCSKYHQDLPPALKELYEIDAFNEKQKLC